MLKFKNQDAYEARFRALQIVDERAAVKSVNGVLPDDAGAITLAPADINAVSVEDVANIRGTFRINVTYSNGVYSADRTFDEIKAAYDAGQQPYVVVTGGTFDLVYTLAHFSVPDGTGQDFAIFERHLIGEDTLATASLTIYSYTTGSGSNIVSLTEEFNAPSGIGIQSVTQTTTSTEDGGTNVITVTKTDGTSSTFTVRNGSKGSTGATGARGATGAAGYTPVRGTDYWTADDIAAIQSYIDEKATVFQTKSITDTGGYFHTDTVEGALQEIGAELAGINTLLGSGIQISFTLGGTTCTANAGETWIEWVGSGYKTIANGMILSVHPYDDEGVIFLDEAGVYALSLDGNTPVHGGDRIISGATYVEMNWGG